MIDKEKNKEEVLGLINTIEKDGINKIIDWLDKSDFFEAPASTRFHLSVPGGLAEHSLSVYKLFKEKCKQYNIDISNDSIILCGLLHDVCKIDLYHQEQKWRKDANGKWEGYYGYGFKDKSPLGHGEKSIYLLQRFINLTMQEAILIRWHMGFFELGELKKYYISALKEFPECILLHTADWESTTLLEKD